MKLKYYLRGVGIGVVGSVLIFMIANAVLGPQISDDEIISRAKELGMVAVEDASATEGTIADSIEEEKEEAQEEAQEEQEDVTTTNENGDTVTVSEEKAQPSSENNVSFTIQGGQSSNTIAASLKSAGLIDDADKFDTYLNQNGYSSRLQPGTYSMREGMTYQEIAETLTTKQ